MQKDLSNFEARLAKFTGAKYAVGVANATDGLQMLLMAGGIQGGDEVIFCSHTMVATASAIHFAGGTPVPVEVGSDHTIDPDSIRQSITPKTKAIVVTQLNGRCANMDPIVAIAKEKGLQVYEDAAQALGAKYKNRHAGTFDMGGCISFYPAKILGCLGDGGAVLCNDEKVYNKLLLLRDHGRGHDGEVVTWGFNSRLDNLQAAFLDQQFDHYDEVMARRRHLASLYHKRLSGNSLVRLPPAPGQEADHFDVFQNFEIEAENRDGLKAYLKDHGVGTLIQWGGKAVHQFPGLGLTQKLPKTDKIFTKLLMLPLNMFVTDQDINYVCDKVMAFYEKK
jgi:dTDP-4-amino-4,6-dideoxygalactose transaminase